MRAIPPSNASANPGLPGFAHFWGWQFAGPRHEHLSARSGALGASSSKTFMHESFPGFPEFARPVNGANNLRQAESAPSLSIRHAHRLATPAPRRARLALDSLKTETKTFMHESFLETQVISTREEGAVMRPPI
jgi:hypothetical protein